MKNNKILAFLLAAILMLAPVMAVQADGAEPQKLIVWNAGLADSDENGVIPKEEIPFNKTTMQFMADHPGVTVEVSRYNMDQMSQLIMAANMSGDLPDVMIMWAGSATNDFQELLVDFGQYMTAEEIDQYNGLDICRKGMSPEGALQALPLGLTTYGAYYNKQVFADAGITELPQTFDQFLAVCQQLKDAGFTPVLVDNSGYTETWILSEFMGDELGAEGLNRFANREIKMGDELIVGLLDRWMEVYRREYVNSDFLSVDGSVLDEMMMNNEAGIRINGSWNHKSLIENMGDNVGEFQIPIVREGAKEVLVSQPGLNITVTTGSKNPQLAVDYAKAISGGPCQAEQCLMFGDLPSNKTSDVSAVTNALTQESFKWLSSGQETVIGFDSLISAEAANEFYKSVMLVAKGDMTSKELCDKIDAINGK